MGISIDFKSYKKNELVEAIVKKIDSPLDCKIIDEKMVINILDECGNTFGDLDVLLNNGDEIAKSLGFELENYHEKIQIDKCE